MKIQFDGRNGWLDGFIGTVASSKKWSETRVSGGGNSYIPYGGGGHINTTISSSVSTKHEFWLVGSDGKEIKSTLDIPVRDGHKVLLIWGAADGCTEGKYKYWENLTTGEKSFTKYATGDFADLILQPDELRKVKKSSNLKWLLIGLCLLSFTLIFPLFIAAFLFYSIRTKNKELIKAANARVEMVKPLIINYRNTLVAEADKA